MPASSMGTEPPQRPNGSRITRWYALAVAGCALCAGGMAATGSSPIAHLVWGALAMFSPLLATVIMDRIDPHPAEVLNYRPKLTRWLPIASATALTLSGATLAISAAMPGALFDLSMASLFETLSQSLPPEEVALAKEQIEALPVHPLILALPQAVIAGATLNALFAFGEEMGWRGWLDREFASLGFWTKSLATGILWGFWHAPLILVGHNYPTQPLPGIFLFVGVCIGLSPLHSWVKERSGSVWTAAVLHGTINASAGMTTLVVAGSELVVGIPGLAGLLATAAMSVALLAVGPRPRSP